MSLYKWIRLRTLYAGFTYTTTDVDVKNPYLKFATPGFTSVTFPANNLDPRTLHLTSMCNRNCFYFKTTGKVHFQY